MLTDEQAPIMDKLQLLMQRLRHPEQGCAWARQQTMESISQYTIEEAYEAVDAILQQDWSALQGELADLLFHVFYYSEMAREQGLFNFNDVANTLDEKIIRRHPHVFDDSQSKNGYLTGQWEQIKAAERQGKSEDNSVLAGIAKQVPALMRADKTQRRAAAVGFDWPDIAGVFDKVQEEISEVQEALAAGDQQAVEDEVGDLLYTCVNLARFCQVDSEKALRLGIDKFERRFRWVEKSLEAKNKTFDELNFSEMLTVWEEAKLQCVSS